MTNSLTEPRFSVSSILYPSLNSSLEGISADVFFYGCTFNCKDCHNKELQEFKQPNTSIEDFCKTVSQHGVKIITFMGGEPLQQDRFSFLQLLSTLSQKFPQLQMNLYTGYELEHIPEDIKSYFTAIKTGTYQASQRTAPRSFLASKNQKYYRQERIGKLVEFRLIYASGKLV